MRASSASGGRFSTRSARSLEELRGALAAGVVGLRQREDLLELVEDQQRHERAAGGVAQHVVAVVQEFPQRLALDGRRPVCVHVPAASVARKIACLICSDGDGDSGA